MTGPEAACPSLLTCITKVGALCAIETLCRRISEPYLSPPSRFELGSAFLASDGAPTRLTAHH